ncbi:Hypothetical predicted protein, partial [Paramuricea clavata]
MRNWCFDNLLLLNPDKTKLMVCESRQMLAKLPDFRLSLLGKKLTPASSVKDLGVKFDPILSFDNHILSTVSSCKSSLCQINRAKHVFPKNLLITVINALVFRKLYYCSSLWSNTSCSNLSRLQGVQNFAARVVSNRRKFDHITPILKELRWFPVKSHLYSRDALLAFKCMNDCAPAYLSSQFKTRGEGSEVTIEGSEVTQPKPSSNQSANDKHLNTEASTGKNRKKKGKKSKSKPPTQNSSQQTADVDTSGGIVNTSSSKSTGQGKKTVIIAGDSIVKNTIGLKMSADDPNHHFIVKPFPGATVSDMKDFVKPLTRRTPDKMILHVGINNLRSHSTPKIIADSIVNIVTQIKEDSP